MSKTFSDEAENCKINCKPTSTAMFDNADSTIEFTQLYTDEQAAQQALEFFTAKAREVENDPCQISSEVQPTENGVLLHAKFVFGCQAEAVIFQMKLR